MKGNWGEGVVCGDYSIRITCNPKRPEVSNTGRTVYRNNPTPYVISIDDVAVQLTSAEMRSLATWLQAFLVRTAPTVR